MGRLTKEIEGSALDTFTATSAADITDTNAVDVKAAVAGERHFVTDITVSNMHATQGTRVDILNDGAVIWSGPAAALGGGFDHSFQTSIPCEVGTAIRAQCGTTGAAVRVSIGGYTKLG